MIEIEQILTSSSYWTLNKEVVRKIGLEPAFMLSNLAEANKLFNDEGWFFQTAESLQEITGMSEYKQTKALAELINLGLLEQKNRGVPMRRFFKINFEEIQKLVFKKLENCNSKNLKTSIQKTSKLYIKPINIKPINIKPIDKANIDKKEGDKSQKSKNQVFDVKNYLQNLGIADEKLIDDFIAHRKAKKSTITERVLLGLIKEAKLAEMSLKEVLEWILEKGYTSFDAQWVKKGNNYGKQNKQDAFDIAMRKAEQDVMQDFERQNKNFNDDETFQKNITSL